MSFCYKIIDWYNEHQRTLPWRGIRDPYRIWLSEIILQQTRIEQGREYYEHFCHKYPTVQQLAAASEVEVLRSWQGLGYYSRARNLHATAKYIVENLDGRFPETYKEILALKGVGRYTAAAIASFAYKLPHPVIHGNGYRLISRLYGITTPIGTTASYKEFEQLLLRLIDREHPDLFNQAMMDFGSTYCKPTGCDCSNCIFANDCVAWKEGRVSLLPIKAQQVKVTNRYFYYLDIHWQQEGEEMTLLHQRTDKDIWKGLFEFPLIESDKPLSRKELKAHVEQHLASLIEQKPIRWEMAGTYKHQLSHRTIHATFIAVYFGETTMPNQARELTISRKELKKYPISRLIDKYLTKEENQ